MTKQELRDFRARHHEIRQLEEQIEALRDISPKTSRFDKILVDSGRTGSPVEQIAERLITLREQYQIELNAHLAEKLRIEKAFVDCLTPNERTALRYYYFEQYTWEQTAERMNKSVRYILSLHKWALIKLREK